MGGVGVDASEPEVEGASGDDEPTGGVPGVTEAWPFLADACGVTLLKLRRERATSVGRRVGMRALGPACRISELPEPGPPLEGCK